MIDAALISGTGNIEASFSDSPLVAKSATLRAVPKTHRANEDHICASGENAAGKSEKKCNEPDSHLMLS
jgi:hypothetical protein